MPRLLFVLTAPQFAVVGCFAFRATPLRKPFAVDALAFLFRLFSLRPRLRWRIVFSRERPLCVRPFLFDCLLSEVYVRLLALFVLVFYGLFWRGNQVFCRYFVPSALPQTGIKRVFP